MLFSLPTPYHCQLHAHYSILTPVCLGTARAPRRTPTKSFSCSSAPFSPSIGAFPSPSSRSLASKLLTPKFPRGATSSSPPSSGSTTSSPTISSGPGSSSRDAVDGKRKRQQVNKTQASYSSFEAKSKKTKREDSPQPKRGKEGGPSKRGRKSAASDPANKQDSKSF